MHEDVILRFWDQLTHVILSNFRSRVKSSSLVSQVSFNLGTHDVRHSRFVYQS